MTLRSVLKSLKTPAVIQSYLDELPYNVSGMTRSANGVFRTQTAHCFDGAIFAAAALESHGAEPLLMDLYANGNDDNHVLAVYMYKKHYGAIAKSNYVGIRFREPVYRTLRELALSYFNNYVTLAGERTLRSYSSLFNLQRAIDVSWREADSHTDIYNDVSFYMDTLRVYRLFPKSVERHFSRADERLIAGESVGLDLKGIYKG